jgi:hypothetical protein
MCDNASDLILSPKGTTLVPYDSSGRHAAIIW